MSLMRILLFVIAGIFELYSHQNMGVLIMLFAIFVVMTDRKS